MSEDFTATVRVSRDGKTVAIDHKFDADWHVVKAAHEALRDWSAARLAGEDECPYKPNSATSEPVAWCSAGQLANLTDVDADGGVYLPIRKTERGNFTMPLYSATPALSPQTLPAPGEVEPVGALLICHQTGGRMWTCWPVPHLKREAAESIYGDRGGYRTVPLYASPTLATVAAANDEGVAEQAAQFADGVAEGAQSLYHLAARDRDTVGTLIHGEAIRVAKHIASAIRLLSQGGGK